MELDAVDQYRVVLEQDLPEFVSKVNTPWDNLPDYEEFNATAYRRITRDIQRINRAREDGRAISRGILLLGEAGAGKTHLLMRAAQHLAKKNHILFVRRPNVEDAVAQHVWAEIIRSLAREVPSSGTKRTQLDEFLAYVLYSVLLPEFERDIREGNETVRTQRWLEALRESPFNLLDMLGEGDSRQANLRTIRLRVLRYFQQNHPEVDQQIASALITYCFVSSENKRIVLTWLSGQEIDEREAQRMGLPPQWISLEEGATDVSVQQRREEKALRAIQSIGALSTYFQPLILAFDQLEGLRDEPRLTRRWGDVVREIFTMAPNFLVVTCIFPSLWTDWFEPNLDAGAVRRIAEQQVLLETFQPTHGTALLAAQMQSSVERHQLPSSTYPFDSQDIASLCAKSKSPSQFIQAAEAAFHCWLDGDETANSTFASNLSRSGCDPTAANIDATLQKTFDGREQERRSTYANDVTTEQDFFGRIHVLLKALMQAQRPTFEKVSWSHYVMPSNLILSARPRGEGICVALINGEGRSFTARMRNFLAVTQDKEQFRYAVLMRDSRCNLPTVRGKQLLGDYEKRKGTCFLNIDAQEYVLLSALYDTLVAIEEQGVSVGDTVLGKQHLVEFIARSGLGRRSQVFRAIAKWSQNFEEVVCPRHLEANYAFADQQLKMLKDPKPTEPVEKFTTLALATTRSKESHVAPIGQPRIERNTRLPNQPSRGAARAELQADAQQASSKRMVETKPAASCASPKIQMLIGDSELDSAHAGVLGVLRESQEVVGISLNKPQCIVLLGYMGSGKSYALGVLVENALLPNSPLVRTTRPMSVVAFNYRRNAASRFEYCGYAEPNSRDDEVAALLSRYRGLPAPAGKVQVFGYGPELSRRQSEYGDLPTLPIQFRAEELGAAHWEILLKPPTPQAEYMDVIRDIIQDLYYGDCLSYRSLEKHILSDTRLSDSQRKRAMNRLTFAARWIADDRTYEWSDVLQEGTLNVFDLRMQTLESDEALKLCLVITDLVRRTRNCVNKLIVFDEAHEYVDSKQLVGELENALTQVRHDGLSFVLASQFPERIPENIMRFFDTRFIFQLPTDKAITYLKRSAPNLKSLSGQQVANLGLERGTCFVQTDNDCSSPDLRSPQLLEIRPRCSQHGGATIRNA